jgi:hypothetical protein
MTGAGGGVERARLRDPDHRRLPRPGEVPELLAGHGFGEDEAQT